MPTFAAPMTFRTVVTLYVLSLGGLVLCFTAAALTLVAENPPESIFSWIVGAALLALLGNMAAIVGMVRACRTAAGALEGIIGLSRPVHSDLLRRLAEGIGLVDSAFTGVEAEAERLKHADPLTGLGNRRWMQLRAPREFHKADQQNVAIGMVLVRVDHLQQINAAHGYEAGDGALLTCADVLKRLLRRDDLAARVSGNEFFVLLPGVGLAGAETVAERLANAIASTPQARLGDATLQVRVAAVEWRREKLFEHTLARAQDAVDQQALPPPPRPALLTLNAVALPEAERALTLM